MPRNSLERRLERLVTGTFARAFRTGVQPIEVGRRMVRELEAGRQVAVHATVAPNHYVVVLAPDDFERFATYADTMASELADTVREHALEYRYRFVGPVEVHLVAEAKHRPGEFRVAATVVEGGERWHATVRMPDGRRVALDREVATIGRLPDCAVQLSDPKCSRYHAEIRHHNGTHRLHDLQSTNGTLLNGTQVAEAELHDGDEIQIGESILRYEES